MGMAGSINRSFDIRGDGKPRVEESTDKGASLLVDKPTSQNQIQDLIDRNIRGGKKSVALVAYTHCKAALETAEKAYTPTARQHTGDQWKAGLKTGGLIAAGTSFCASAGITAAVFAGASVPVAIPIVLFIVFLIGLLGSAFGPPVVDSAIKSQNDRTHLDLMKALRQHDLAFAQLVLTARANSRVQTPANASTNDALTQPKHR